MLAQDKRIILNKLLLVGGLTITRLPRVFGLDINAWALMLTLIPYWFVILDNHLPDVDLLEGPLEKYYRLFIQLILLVIISSSLLIISTIFIRGFLDEGAFGYHLASLVIVVAAIAGFVFYIFKVNDKVPTDKKILWIGIVYFLFVIASIFRASAQAPFLLLYIFQYITIIFFCISAKIELADGENDYFYFVYLGLALYIFVNVVLYFAGFVNPTETYLREYDAVLLSLFGFQTFRIYYPLAEGINPFGMVGGLGFVISVAYAYKSHINKIKEIRVYIIPFICAVLCVYVILTTDTRGAILFAFITSVLIIFFGYVKSKLLYSLIFLSQLSVFSSLMNFKSNNKLFTPFIREGSDILSGRGVVWSAALRDLANFKWINLVGFGVSGQTKSGIVNEYSHQFISYINKTSISLHHFGLQGIYDYGYLGVVVAYLLMLLMGFGLLRNSEKILDNKKFLPILASMIYLIFAGSLSVIPTFYTRDLFLLFPFIWISACAD